MSRIWIHGGRVLTQDPALGELARGDVLIEDERIVAVAPDLGSVDAERIDATHAIVLPGLVDTHRHVWQTQLRTVAADWTLFDYFTRMRSLYGCFYTAEDVALGNHVGALEALAAGITTLVDHCHVLHSPEHADAALDGLLASGIRAVFCYGLFPSPLHHPFRLQLDPAWRFDDARRVRTQRLAADDGLVRFGLAPSELEAMPLETIARELDFARALGAQRISCHVAMGRYDRGRRLVLELARGGRLGPDVLLVHGGAFSDEELAAIADSGAGISSTPETELQMGMGRPIAPRALAHGAAASLGVDIVSNYAGDLFAQMRLLLQAERGFRHAEETGPPRRLDLRVRDVLALATTGGARVAGLGDHVGSLSPGKQADVVIVRTDAIHLTPAPDPAAALVLYAGPSDVDTVLVAGRVVKRGGKLVGVDWPRLAQRVRASSARILAEAHRVPIAEIEAISARLML